MKKIYLLLLAGLSLVASCDKSKDNIKLGDLPGISETGANTFGCMINGKGYIPQTHLGSYILPLEAAYFGEYNGSRNWSISIGTIDDNHIPNVSFHFIIDSAGMRTGSMVVLHSDTAGHLSSAVLDKFGIYKIISPQFGQLQILKYDVPGKILAGTFSFSAVDTAGNKAVITDGRFDVKLQ